MPVANPIHAIVRSYDSSVIRLYSRIRFIILDQVFLGEIAQYLPRNGRVLDIGCGFGLFSLYFASLEPERRILGVDLNAGRIEHARHSAEKLGLDNVEYEVGEAQSWETEERFDAIYLLDVVHHLPREGVPEFLSRLRDRLGDGGTLLLKEVEDRPAYKRLFTLALDRLMVGFEEPIHYWSTDELGGILEGLGFDVKVHHMRDVLPYPHVLYVCRLSSDASTSR